MAMTNVGAQIRTARKTANLSQAELGQAIGRTSKTVRRYEQNKTTPDTRVLSLIADATDHPIEFFVHVDVHPAPRRSAAARRPPRPITRASDALARSQNEGAGTSSVHSPGITMIPIGHIQNGSLEKTSETRRIPTSYLKRVGLAPGQALIFNVPEGHYSLRRETSGTLLLDVLPEPVTLDAFVKKGRFVDGRYMLNIGASGLQIKDVMARPDGTFAIASIDGAQRFRCQPEDQKGVRIHAIVASDF